MNFFVVLSQFKMCSGRHFDDLFLLLCLELEMYDILAKIKQNKNVPVCVPNSTGHNELSYPQHELVFFYFPLVLVSVSW